MKTKLTVLTFVCLALVLLTGTVRAGGAGGVISLTAQVLDLNPDGSPPGTMRVYVQMTNIPYASWRGSERLVKTTSDTVFLNWENLEEPFSFDDLAQGDWMSINGVVNEEGVIEARRVEVAKPRIPSSLLQK
jgi:hypothetical protein